MLGYLDGLYIFTNYFRQKGGPGPLFIVKKMVAKERKKKVYEKSVLVREKKVFW